MTAMIRLVACPACYGDPNSPMTAGMNTAVLVMLGITGTVLLLLTLGFFLLYRRAKKMHEGLSGDLFVDERGTLKAKQGKGVVEWNNS
jgi:LPXTG-motif cell wall-anchored protein